MATPFSSVDPLAVQAKRVSTAQIDPLAPAKAVQTATTLGSQAMEFDLSKQFQRLLQAGQEGMNQTYKKLIEEGEVTEEEIPNPNEAAFQSAQGQLAWYKGVGQVLQQKQAVERRAQMVEKQPKEIVSEEYVRTGGVEEAKKLLDTREEIAKRERERKSRHLEEEAQEFISNMLIEKIDPDDPGEKIKISKSEAYQRLAGKGLAETDAGKSFIKTIEKPDSKLEEWMFKRGFIEDEQRRNLYLKLADKMSNAVVAVNDINDAFIESGVEGGVWGDVDKGFGVVGLGSKLWRNWINSDEAIKVRIPINQWLLDKQRAQSGVAVRKDEWPRLEKALGLNNRSTVKAFVEAIRNSIGKTEQRLGNYWQNMDLEDRVELKSKGIITPESLPQPGQTEPQRPFEGKERKKTPAKVKSEEVTEESVYNKVKNMTPEQKRRRVEELKRKKKE